ncbi:MAG: hypothetical protein AVDCRST_MAG93-5244, partial [uncultured Chloroflexia bacterium]
ADWQLAGELRRKADAHLETVGSGEINKQT